MLEHVALQLVDFLVNVEHPFRQQAHGFAHVGWQERVLCVCD
jgi:hypothetical protein